MNVTVATVTGAPSTPPLACSPLSAPSFASDSLCLSTSLSPGSSCCGVVLLAKRGRRRHTDGSTDGQQAAQGGSAHLLHAHKHTHRAQPPHHSQPAWHCGTVAPRHTVTNTNTIGTCIHYILNAHMFVYSDIHRFFHTFNMLWHYPQYKIKVAQ